MATPDPRLVQAIRQQPRYLQVPLLTTALIESGGRLDAVGDGGRSHGAYQMYDLGRGAGVPISKRRDPVFSTKVTAQEFQTFYDRGARGGDLAYRAQRPADRGNYLSKYAQYQRDAQRILAGAQGTSGPVETAAPVTSASRPAGRRSGSAGAATRAGGVSPDAARLVMQYARESEQDVLAGRAPRSIDPILPALANAVKRTMPTGAPPEAGRDVALDGIRQVGRPADPSANQVVNAAKQYLGTPYSWGGGTPSGPTRGFAQGANTVGFDCSSLVQMAWAKKGVKLPRTTYEQIKVGQPVANIGQAQPGDLVFPSTGHVQMYIGNGKVIEAPRTGGKVQIVPARSSYIAIRRPG